MITLTITSSNTALLPEDHIYLLEDLQESSAKTSEDIYGSPMVVTLEQANARARWTIGAAYVDISIVDACKEAYAQHTPLTLCDEAGASFEVVISEYPSIERHKALESVLYTIKCTVAQDNSTFGIPPVISTSGPRLFSR